MARVVTTVQITLDVSPASDEEVGRIFTGMFSYRVQHVKDTQTGEEKVTMLDSLSETPQKDVHHALQPLLPIVKLVYPEEFSKPNQET